MRAMVHQLNHVDLLLDGIDTAYILRSLLQQQGSCLVLVCAQMLGQVMLGACLFAQSLLAVSLRGVAW